MLNILWYHNVIIPQISEVLGEKIKSTGGWLVKMTDEISKMEGVSLTICFPYSREIRGTIENVNFYGICMEEKNITYENVREAEISFAKVLETVVPDVVHVFGTESRRAYAVTEVCKKRNIQAKVCISIQGMVSIYSKHYLAYLPFKIAKQRDVRDKFRRTLLKEQYYYGLAGTYEELAIKNVSHVIGRTDWDQSCCYYINPSAKYHFCNEMLRESFYTSQKWKWSKCKKHTIFFSQSYSPIKGLHLALEALVLLKKEFPDVILKIAGENYLDKPLRKMSLYERYIIKMIKQNHLKENICFTGMLSEKQMVAAYLETNVFLCTSSIENSPNSLCEGMILGVPCVSSYVGGVGNLMEHEKEGYYYPADEPYMAAYYIKQIFEKKDIAENISKNAVVRAEERHNVANICSDLMNAYKLMLV